MGVDIFQFLLKFFHHICALLFAQATTENQGFNSLFHSVLCQIHKVPDDYKAEHLLQLTCKNVLLYNHQFV